LINHPVLTLSQSGTGETLPELGGFPLRRGVGILYNRLDAGVYR
jgi:hypothetical protein